MSQSCNTKHGWAEIPHAVIDKRYANGKDLLHKYPGQYVTVREEGGATYHVSNPGINCLPNAVLVAEGKIYRDGFNPATAPDYKNARIVDFANNREYIYDHLGDVRYITLQEVA